MKKFLVFTLLTFFSLTAYGAEISGVTFPDNLTVGQENLILNGLGLRKKLVVKVYAAGLYLKEKSSDALAIIEADQAMAIVLKFIHDEVPQDKLIEAWNEGFTKSTKGDTSRVQNEIKEFNSIFTAPARKGDAYEFTYAPKEGVIVKYNGKEVKRIPGLPFKKALFGIWFCEEPADKSLKEGLLGLK